MKYLKVGILSFLLGVLLIQIPDLICLYDDHVIHGYQKAYCMDKGIGPDQCDFGTYFEPYAKDHPTLKRVQQYFMMGEGSLYYSLSGKCSNRLFHNPSAAPNDTGKITLRDYFIGHCSQLDVDVSDLIFGDKTK